MRHTKKLAVIAGVLTCVLIHSGMAQAGDSLMKVLTNGQGPLSRFMSDPTLYDRLNKLTTDLGAILDDVRKDPRRYTKGMICVLCRK